MKIKLIIAGSIALFLALAIGLLMASREPEYGGRKLSSWLEDLDWGEKGYDRLKVLNAQEAVRRIGSRGVPTLIRMMRYRDRESSWRVRWRRLLAKQKIIRIPEPLSATAVEHIQWRAVEGVRLLGPKAEAAIPGVIPLLTNQSAWVRSSAAIAIGSIGTNAGRATPFLINMLEEPQVFMRISAAMGLEGIGPDARCALPALRRCFDDPNRDMRCGSMWAFLSITNASLEVLPYLVRQLNDPVFNERGRAVSMLRSLGKAAQGALPELTRLLNDPDKNVRRAVTNALNTITSNEPPPPRDRAAGFWFPNMPFNEVLEFYGRLTGKRIEMAPEIRVFTAVTITPIGIRTVDEAARVIEEELSEQADLVLTPSTNGVVFVRCKQSAQK